MSTPQAHAAVHHCWGPHRIVADPAPCYCKIGTDHDHDAYRAQHGLNPLTLSEEQARTVVVFGMHKPGDDSPILDDSEGTRSGMVAFAWVVGAFIVISLAALGLIAYGVTHP